MSEKQEENSVPFYPDHLALEAKVALGFTILVVIIGVIGLFYPIGLGIPADPMDTPLHTKPEWYFLFLYQLLRYIPKTIGALILVFLRGGWNITSLTLSRFYGLHILIFPLVTVTSMGLHFLMVRKQGIMKPR